MQVMEIEQRKRDTNWLAAAGMALLLGLMAFQWASGEKTKEPAPCEAELDPIGEKRPKVLYWWFDRGTGGQYPDSRFSREPGQHGRKVDPDAGKGLFAQAEGHELDRAEDAE